MPPLACGTTWSTRQVPEREVCTASRAVPLLLAVQRVLVRAVVRQARNVGTARDVVSAHRLEQQGAFAVHAGFDKLGGERRQVDAYPLAFQAVSRNTRGRAAAERVEYHVAGVG